ncbi:MAG TPA: YceI family protein [Caulobacteraceae bacterium]
MRLHSVLAAMILALALNGPALAVSRDPSDVPAGTYELDKRHASIIAKVPHMGLTSYVVRFNSFDAGFTYDPKNPTASQVKVTVDVNSIDVGDPALSAKFAKEFLNGDDHPTATFVATELKAIDATRGTMKGDLTLRGVTRPVTLNVAFDGYTSTALAGNRVGFSATGQIDRTEFGSTFLSPEIVGDEVDIFIEAEFLKK